MDNIKIRFENIKYEINDNVILNDASFKITNNTINLITGKMASGKSTILNLLSGIIPNLIHGKIWGDILIDNVSIKKMKLSKINEIIAIVMQNPEEQIISEYVIDELSFGLENVLDKKISDDIFYQKIKDVANLLKLDLNKKTKELSGGEKERLIIGSILLTGQKIILLDEPFANLDIESISILKNTFLKLKEKGYTIIIAEHRINELKDIVDDIFLLKDQKVSKIDNINNFLKNDQELIIDDIININNRRANPLIKAENINYKYRDNLILNDLSFEIKDSGFFLILGKNGAGKTTLLKLIAKLIKNKLFRYNLKIKKSKWFNYFGYIFQNPEYQLFMPTVLKEISYKVKDKTYLEKIIKDFNLENLLLKHPQSLSMGQKRLVSIATILVRKPKVLLLDEPTVGQDFNSLKKLITILREYQSENNASIILTTHDKRCAKYLADDILLIKDNYYKLGKLELLDEYFND